MTTDAKKLMAISQKPTGEILVTSVDVRRMPGDTDASLAEVYRACLGATSTEILPRTEAAYADFAARHGGRLLYPTLAAYPAPTR